MQTNLSKTHQHQLTTMNNWKAFFTSLMPYVGILSVLILFFGSGCSSPTHPGITAKDVTGLHYAGDSATNTFEMAVPDLRMRTRCDNSTWTETICTARPVTQEYVKQGPLANPDSLAKALNEIAYGSAEGSFWRHPAGQFTSWVFSGPGIGDLLKAILFVLLLIGLIWVIIAFLRWLWRSLLGSGLRSEDRARLNLIDSNVQALRNDVANGFARLNSPRTPTPDASVTGVTTSRDIEKIDVTDGKIHLKLDAHGLRFPIIVTSKGVDDKVHTLTIGSGRFQTPADAGSGTQAPSAPRGAE